MSSTNTMRVMWCERPQEVELRHLPIHPVGDDDVLVKVATGHSASASSWFGNLESQPQFISEAGLFNDVRKFLNAPKSK